jgi:hypothetical protein
MAIVPMKFTFGATQDIPFKVHSTNSLDVLKVLIYYIYKYKFELECSIINNTA